MRRSILLTIGAVVVTGVVAGLARDARSLDPGIARGLLLLLFTFLVMEWAAHFLGSRVWGRRAARADRAAWAALSSAGIWIALLAIVPFLVSVMGLSPLGTVAVVLTVLAAAGGLGARLWFLREIYEISLDRAAVLWAITRGTATAIVVMFFALYMLASSTPDPAPMLSLHP